MRAHARQRWGDDTAYYVAFIDREWPKDGPLKSRNPVPRTYRRAVV